MYLGQLSPQVLWGRPTGCFKSLRWVAQQGMQHLALLAVVDHSTSKHGVAVLCHPALAGQGQQQPLGGVVDQVFGQVGEHMRRTQAKALKAAGVAGKSRAQVKRPASGRKCSLQIAPGGRSVAAGSTHLGTSSRLDQAASKSWSSRAASAQKARMPSASLSVAMASSFRASRKPASS